MSRSALNVAVAIGALHLHPSPDAAFDSSARVPADSPVREVSVLAAPVELLARTSRAAVVSALGRLKLAIGGRRGGWSPTAAAAVPPPKTARFRLQAVKDVAVSGRFVHQWELLREAIAALAAEVRALRAGGVLQSTFERGTPNGASAQPPVCCACGTHGSHRSAS